MSDPIRPDGETLAIPPNEAESIAGQTHNTTRADDLHDCAKAFVRLYAAWDQAEPGKDHDATATEWKQKLDALDAVHPAAVVPQARPIAHA